MQPNNTPKRPETAPDISRRPASIDGMVTRRDYNPRIYRRDSLDGMQQPVSRRPISPNVQPTSTPPPTAAQVSQPQFKSPPEQNFQPSNNSFQAPPASPQKIDFTPPSKKRKKLPRIPRIRAPKLQRRTSKALQIFVITIIAIGALSGLYVWYKNQNSPEKLFLTAYQKNLSTSNYSAYTNSGGLYSRIGYDFVNPKNPIIFSDQNISNIGAVFTAEGYGTSKETYIRYTKLPKAIQPPLSQAGLNTYVKIRSEGALPSGVPASIIKASDPRYRIIGPILFSNLDKSKADQILNYIKNNNVYQYDKKDVKSTKLNGKKVTVFNTKLDVTKVQLINQSLASMMGFTPADVEGAIKGLDNYKDAVVKIYINSDKRIVRIEASGQLINLSTDYSEFNKISTPMEPETKVLWQNFATVHYQMQAASANVQPVSIVDNARKARLSALHDQLIKYQKQTSSFPAIDNLNNPNWVNSNLIGFDVDLLRDPTGTSLAVQASPTGSSLAYVTTPEIANGKCANTPENPCAHFRVISILSSGKQYLTQDP